MISQNVYVKFDTFNTRDEVLDFVYDEKELNSNINNWKEDLDKYIREIKKHRQRYTLWRCFLYCLYENKFKIIMN